MRLLGDLFGLLPEPLARQAFTHASWVEQRADSYERLAFLGDSVLGLAVTTHLFPRLDPERYGAGRLTKVRAQAVSGAACRRVGDRLGVPERLEAEAGRVDAPERQGPSVHELVASERVLASIVEAIIGACYVEFGYERTAAAVVEAFEPEIAEALAHPVDFKSALQEALARRGDVVDYEVADVAGPPHRRTFTVVAQVGERPLGRGRGRSKQDAEQSAAREALDALGAEAGLA